MIYAILLSIPQPFALPAISRKPGDPPYGLEKMGLIQKAKIPNTSAITSPSTTKEETENTGTCPTLLSRPELCN